MKAVEFITKVRALILSQEEIVLLNGDERFNACFNLKDKTQKLTSTGSNEILNLIDNYELFSFNIFGISFDQTYSSIGDKIIFGSTEFSRLYINTKTLEIEAQEYDEETLIINVAKSANHFIDILFELLDLYSKRIRNIVDVDDETVNTNILNICIEKAGGKKYSAFYKSLGIV